VPPSSFLFGGILTEPAASTRSRELCATHSGTLTAS
jgi:hypothetical protein